MDALIKVIDDWEYAIDKKQTVHSVFFDFQKAFDLVDHTILLNKLQKFKLRERGITPLAWDAQRAGFKAAR